MPGSLFSRVRLDRIFRPRYNFGSSIFTNEEFCAMYIADLHIHSRYSRATSKDCTPEHLDLWARRKGIHLVGSGDFTHPAWREELKEKLRQDENGLYVLKEEYRIHEDSAPDHMIPRFVITGEISSIYKQGGKVRKVHSLILLPDLQKAEIISRKLEEIGNIHSDGRPILGISCHDLLEIILNCARRPSMCRLISGRRIFPCSVRSQGLIPWKNVLETSPATCRRWKPGFPPTRR